MKKSKEYKSTLFSSGTLNEIRELFIKLTDSNNEDKEELKYWLVIEFEDEEWEYDSVEVFLADYIKFPHYAIFQLSYHSSPYYMRVFTNGINTKITVAGENRDFIEIIFNAFEKHVDVSTVPDRRGIEVKPPTIFIGHGRDTLWKELKDHLQEQHNYKIEAYDIGPRAGHGISDILKDMMDKSSMAFLVMTGEDLTQDHQLRARQNVIHEIGLFQGRLGFSKAIVLLEKGVEEFTNLVGTDQIRFSKSNIKETFGDVLATIKRELS